MHDAHHFLQALTVVLCVAAITTVTFQKLKLPVVLGYLLAGLIVGPHVPIPLVVDTNVVQTLSELGVILLMFSLGLEFSLRKLLRVGPVAALTAVIECSLMLWLGYLVGRALGWATGESLFAGAIVAISSTTIIAKTFDEQKVRGRLRELVVGILVVEDLIAILLMATLTALSTGRNLSAGELGLTVGKLGAFLVGLVAVGMLVVPKAVRRVVKLERPETTLVFSIGLCFAVALLAQYFGYSVALGAFLAGSLVAESGEEKQIEHLVRPVRDIFAAIFFVSVGILIDPTLVWEHRFALFCLTLLVMVGKVVGVFFGAFTTGNGIRTSVQAGMSLAQIGEFSFIIAGLGLSLGATGRHLYPVAVAVSAVTTLTTPWMVRAADPVARSLDRHLPPALQTFSTLYVSWVDRLKTSPAVTAGGLIRRLMRLLALDAAVLTLVIIGTSVWLQQGAVTQVGQMFGLSDQWALVAVVLGATSCCIPFLVGLVRIARRMGLELALVALPSRKDQRLDLAAAPRRALVAGLQLATLTLVSVPVVALVQPFVPRGAAALVIVPGFALLGVSLWKSAANLQGHVRAGAQMLVEALAAQAASSRTGPIKTGEHALSEVNKLLPGLGEPVPFMLEAHHEAVGKTLSDLDVRGRTGASVLAIHRKDRGVLVPTAREVLQAGDLLALAGAREGVDAARELLAKRRTAPVSAELGANETVEVMLRQKDAGVGKTLAELDVHGKTGATVLAVRRPELGVVIPTGKDVLREGDVLTLAGLQPALEAARALLSGPGNSGSPSTRSG